MPPTDARTARLRAVSNRLEPRNWRTTQRENAADYEQRATAGKWSMILTAIINFQNHHNGMSPPDHVIAKTTGLSIGQVQYHLREMEKGGLIKDGKRWPRIIEVKHVAKVQSMTQLEAVLTQAVAKTAPTKEAEVVDTSQLETKNKAPNAKRAEFVTRARQVAQAVIDYWDEHGKAPMMHELHKAVYPDSKTGGTHGGGIHAVVSKMVKLGWVRHERKRQRDITVTGLGRAALFGTVQEPLHTDTQVNRAPVGRLGLDTPLPIDPAAQWNPPPKPMPKPMIPRDPTPSYRVMTPEDLGLKVKVAPAVDLASVGDLDLVLELNKRGFKVSK